MRKPDSKVFQERGWQYERPHSDLSLVMIGLVCLLAWIIYEVWSATYVPSNQELQKAYRQGWEAALNTKRVHKDLEGACLTLWWGQNAGNN
jgi:hypothetical protein